MFVVDEAMATAVRRAFDERGEWPAVAELRRHVCIDDNDEALRVVRTIASWRRSPEASGRPPA
ncbi:hypothetical protein [Azospirillum rugosum]|uniref:Uncharacterized protein n=1 Tax=Azospirillum rugosum TaxID=416170 RepID=A0ABS4SXB2_9PROT|nr:hypothetical protein [Azospirillum rugosum]MBP2296899.1 hypothetical protein [Azospirillum rugosum]MDQ0530517.1 hypothetical protein [Azospirillum rugosum]